MTTRQTFMMGGWVQARSDSPIWHQASYNSRTGTAVLACSLREVIVTPDKVMDYRWRPSVIGQDQCRHPACQNPVGP